MAPRATASSPIIPTFYRFFFTWLDPSICIWAIYMDFFTPDVVYNAFIPLSLAPPNRQHDFLLQQLGGAFVVFAILDIVLLRYTSDIGIWRILQAAVLSYDLILLWSIYDGLQKQGRLNVEGFRPVEDGGSIAITATAALVRTLFLMDVGIKRKKSVSNKEL